MATLDRVMYPRPVRWLKGAFYFGALVIGLSAIPFEFYLATSPSTTPQFLINDMVVVAAALLLLMTLSSFTEPIYDRLWARRLNREPG